MAQYSLKVQNRGRKHHSFHLLLRTSKGDLVLETMRTDAFTLTIENQRHVPFRIAGSQDFGWTLVLTELVDYEHQAYYHMVVKAMSPTLVVFSNFTIKVSHWGGDSP